MNTPLRLTICLGAPCEINSTINKGRFRFLAVKRRHNRQLEFSRASVANYCPARESKSVSRILYSIDFKSEIFGVAIIPLARSLPTGSSDLPGGRSSRNCFGRAALLTPPYLVLHREEFAWPRMSPHAPVRSYIKPLRAAPFHPSPRVSDPRS